MGGFKNTMIRIENISQFCGFLPYPSVIHLVVSFVLGHVEWDDLKEKHRCYLMWRTPDEWADMIYKWVN